MKVIDRAELLELLQGSLQLVEVLPADEFEGSHIPGAINLPLTDLSEQRARAVLSTAEPVVVYCQDQL
jgi:rhodanese-related sulfurtransferase